MDRKLTIAGILLLLQLIAFPLVRAYDLYHRFWFTDVLLHIEAGVMFGLVWLWVLKKSIVSKKIAASTTIFFATTMSFLWEVWEFWGWHLFPGRTQNYIPDLGDSLSDIACGLFGALILCLIIFIQRNNKNY
ncbi:hypothetical protein BH11PAT3_BH11PAT3_1550 [soil metagenome]